MNHATLDYALSLKSAPDETGVFEGYGSIFGNVDSYGEKVAPGAFSASLAKSRREGAMPLMLWQHDPTKPIGVWEDMAEDGKGLYVKGRLIQDVTLGREALALMRANALRGLSIGYREIDTERDAATGVVTIKLVDLFEVSVVSFPANRRARVESVKAGVDPQRWWDLHDRLRALDADPADSSAVKKEIEGLFQAEGCPKSLRPFFAKRLAGSRSDSGAESGRGEPGREVASQLAEFARLMRAG